MTIQNGPVSYPEATAGASQARQLPVKNPYTGEVDYQITPPTPCR